MSSALDTYLDTSYADAPLKTEDPAWKIISTALGKGKIDGNEWHKYVLLIRYNSSSGAFLKFTLAVFLF